MNGRFISEPRLDNIQASLENRGSDYLFVVAENMENAADASTGVDINKEVARLHEKITSHEGDLEFKTREIQSRIGDAARLLESILEMNHTPEEDDRWQVGFSGLLLADGHAVAATVGTGHVYLMREDSFMPLARESTKREKLVRLGVLTDKDAEREDLVIQEDEAVAAGETDSPVIMSEPVPFCEHDTYLLISQGVFESLGEERIEDILAAGGESTAMAGKIVDEAMKRTTRGDLTAMAVQIEKIYDIQGAARKPMLKSRVDALSKTPAVTYKYNRKPTGRDNIMFAGLFALTVVVVLAILYILISSFFPKADKPKATATPKPSVTAATTAGTETTATEETTVVAETSGTEAATVVTSSTAAESQTYTVQKGDTMSGIVKKYYNDVSLIDALAEFNNISDPSRIQPGDVIKIPPVDILK
jgi:LysM repeat protein/serine/threonine protein phosphatase PrpC